MKIICVDSNYSDSCIDGNEAKTPSFYIKPDTALLRNNEPFYIPSFGEDFRCSVEFVVRFNRVAKSISARFAGRCFDEVGLAVNFTAVDVVEQCRALGLSADRARSFDHSSAMAPKFISVSELGELSEVLFEMSINGSTVQSTKLSHMSFGVDTIIAYVSDFTTLKIGDLISTGGASEAVKIAKGDVITATLNGVEMLNFEIR